MTKVELLRVIDELAFVDGVLNANMAAIDDTSKSLKATAGVVATCIEYVRYAKDLLADELAPPGLSGCRVKVVDE